MECDFMKISAVGLFVILFSVNVFGRTSILKSQGLYIKPSSGKTLALGKVRPNFRGGVDFYPIKSWTEAPLQAQVHEGISFWEALFLIGSDKLLFYSTEITRNGLLGEGAFNGVISQSNREHWVWTIKDLATRDDVPGIINPSWQFCEKHDECVVAFGRCGVTPLNKAYLKKFELFTSRKKDSNECPKVDTEKLNLSKGALCVKDFCSFEEKSWSL